MIDLIKAQSLCSKSEWNLVKGSFAHPPETETTSNLKSKISLVKGLHQKCTDTIAFLHSDLRITRTRQKIELFAEVIQRLQAELATLEARREASAENETVGKTVMDIPSLGLTSADRADSRIVSPLTRRGDDRVQKSGATPRSHLASIPRRQQGRRNSSKNH